MEKNKVFNDFIDGFSIDDNFDPFQKNSEEKLLTKRTTNRRRWSHVIPLGEREFKVSVHELKWKSLSTPAVLPLTTDYCPGARELDSDHLSVRVSQIDLSSHSSAKATYRHWLVEMVTQRLTFDFQLVDVEGNQTTTMKTARTNNVDGLSYTLSMGHVIHHIKCSYPYNQVHITEYNYKRLRLQDTQTDSSESESESYQYRFVVWVPLINGFQEMVQSFNRYAAPVNWNRIDRLIVANTELDPLEWREPKNNTKYKRLLFTILPPVLTPECSPTAREWLEAHFSNESLRVKPVRQASKCNVKK